MKNLLINKIFISLFILFCVPFVYGNEDIFLFEKSNNSIIDTISVENILDELLIEKKNFDKIEFDLSGIFKEVKKNSLDFKRLDLSKLNLRQDRDNSRFYFIPTVNFTTSLPLYSKSMNSDSSFSISSSSVSSSMNLTQNLPFNSNLTFSYLNGISENYGTEYISMNKGFNFSISTPFFYGMNLFSEYNSKKRVYRTSKRRISQDIIDFQYLCVSNFFNLFRIQSRFNLDKKGYELSVKNYNEVLRKYNIGILPEVDLLDLQLNMEKNKLSFLKTNYNLDLTVKKFNLFLGIPIDKNTVLKYLELSDILDDENIFNNKEKHILATNLEILSIKDAIKNKEDYIRNIYRSNYANGTLSFFYNLNNTRSGLGNDIDGDFYYNFDKLNENKGFSFTLNIPIFNRNIFTNSLERTKFELKLLKDELLKKKNEIKLDLKSKFDNIEFNKKNYEISIKSNKLAKKIYDISLKRFENGLLTSKDLIQNQINFLESNLQLVNSRIDLELSIYELKRFAGEDLIYEW